MAVNAVNKVNEVIKVPIMDNWQRSGVEFIVKDSTRTGVTGVQRSLSTLDRQARDVQRLFTGLGAGLGIGLGTVSVAGLSRGLRSAFDEAVGFERQMALINTQLDRASARHLPGYKRGIQQMAVTYGESTETLNKGLYDILSAAVAPARALELLDVSVKAAKGGFTTTATAADALTTVLNSYGMSVDQATRVSDVMFATVKRGKLTYEELARGIGHVASQAALAGLSIEDIGAAIATMTRAGMQADIAITSLRTIINAFLKPTKEARAAAREFGLDLNAATLRALGLVGVLQKLRTATPEQLAAIVPEARGFAGFAAQIQNLEGNLQDLAAMTAAAGSAQEALEKATATTSHAIDQWREAWQGAKREFAEPFLPDITRHLQDLTSTVTANGPALRRWASDMREGVLLMKDIDLTAWRYMTALPRALAGAMAQPAPPAPTPWEKSMEGKAQEEYRQITGDMGAFQPEVHRMGLRPKPPEYPQKYEQILGLYRQQVTQTRQEAAQGVEEQARAEQDAAQQSEALRVAQERLWSVVSYGPAKMQQGIEWMKTWGETHKDFVDNVEKARTKLSDMTREIETEAKAMEMANRGVYRPKDVLAAQATAAHAYLPGSPEYEESLRRHQAALDRLRYAERARDVAAYRTEVERSLSALDRETEIIGRLNDSHDRAAQLVDFERMVRKAYANDLQRQGQLIDAYREKLEDLQKAEFINRQMDDLASTLTDIAFDFDNAAQSADRFFESLARGVVNEFIMQPLTDAIGVGLKSLGKSTPKINAATPGAGGVHQLHGGGIVGTDGAAVAVHHNGRSVGDMSVSRGLPRGLVAAAAQHLRPDERLIVAQVGERVQSRDEVRRENRLASVLRYHEGGVVGKASVPSESVPASGGAVRPNVTVNFSNQTGTAMAEPEVATDFSMEEYIVSVVLRNQDQGGPIRDRFGGRG